MNDNKEELTEFQGKLMFCLFGDLTQRNISRKLIEKLINEYYDKKPDEDLLRRP
tara:strand:- start:21 stop:182 length:162 start_codon:yes stop_codon:yes gene_type:complete